MTRGDVQAARKQLESWGWQLVCSVMSDSGSQGENFGLYFTRNGQKFYLNFKTIWKVWCNRSPLAV